jgi:hypothetical protein
MLFLKFISIPNVKQEIDYMREFIKAGQKLFQGIGQAFDKAVNPTKKTAQGFLNKKMKKIEKLFLISNRLAY